MRHRPSTADIMTSIICAKSGRPLPVDVQTRLVADGYILPSLFNPRRGQ